MVVCVRLWGPSPTYPDPHGTVHNPGCGHIRDPDSEGWRRAASREAADLDFPDHVLFWCSANGCFGPDNPRRIPR